MSRTSSSSTRFILEPKTSSAPCIYISFTNIDDNVVGGHVDVPASEILVPGLRISFVGVAKVCKPRAQGVNEQVFYNDEHLITDLNIREASRPCPGVLRVNFLFEMPADLPPSFCDHLGNGEVTYSVRVIARRDSNKLVILKERNLSPITGLNLNCIPEVAEKINEYMEGHGVSARFKVQRSGYLPGERIQVDAQIRSKRHPAAATINLLQVVSYEWKKGRVIQKTYVKSCKTLNCVERKGNITWTPEVTIPEANMPVTSYNMSTIVDINYKLQFSVTTTKEKTISKTSDIYIGTVPFDCKSLMQYIQTTYHQHPVSTDSTESPPNSQDRSTPIAIPAPSQYTCTVSPRPSSSSPPHPTPSYSPRGYESPCRVPVVNDPDVNNERLVPTAPPYERFEERPPAYEEVVASPSYAPPEYENVFGSDGSLYGSLS